MTRTWLVTGAGRGLGRALALSAAAAGDLVLATVRREGAAPQHERIVEHVLDVRDRDGAFAAVARAVDELGGLDVLVNNAGFGLVGTVEEVDEDAVRELVDTNLLGAVWLTQAALPVMRARRSGHIVQVSSTGGVGTVPALGAYTMTKWALEAVSESLAAEVADLGVRVSIVEPGGIDTEWGTGSMRFASPVSAYDDLRERLFGTPVVPWGASGTSGETPPEEIAAAILRHVADPDDPRLRVLAGDDAPAQVAAALAARLDDYHHDDRFAAAMRSVRG